MNEQTRVDAPCRFSKTETTSPYHLEEMKSTLNNLLRVHALLIHMASKCFNIRYFKSKVSVNENYEINYIKNKLGTGVVAQRQRAYLASVRP